MSSPPRMVFAHAVLNGPEAFAQAHVWVHVELLDEDSQLVRLVSESDEVRVDLSNLIAPHKVTSWSLVSCPEGVEICTQELDEVVLHPCDSFALRFPRHGITVTRRELRSEV